MFFFFCVRIFVNNKVVIKDTSTLIYVSRFNNSPGGVVRILLNIYDAAFYKIWSTSED